ncbi:WD repeat domain-containing protein 83 [Chelonus insularis]|uniref:WD repeat domain-containing protein 83 n=1 Tax=Chelonus insularis TaxID=460826 RepID=UPI00158A072B|nr:WD repeat domain-containing protein 83 [Chelonus insularis]
MEFKFVHSLHCKEGAIRVVRFNTDGAYCITGSSDRRLRLWNPHRNALLKTYSGHGGEVMDASASCDSSQIISCGLDKSVILWDVATGNPVRRFRGHSGGVMTVCFNEESSMAISGSRDNSVKCWDIRSKNQEPVQTLNEAKDAISSIKVSDHEIISASFDCRIRRYDIRAGEVTSDCLGEAITCVSFTRDGQCTLASCADGVIRLLDKDTGELLNEFKGHTVDDLCLESSVDYNDSKVLSGSADGKLWVWDLTNQKVLAKLSGDEKTKYPTVSLSVHPQENSILATNGTNVFMWNVQTE